MSNANYIERLEQAVRVMRGLSEHDRKHHFNIGVFARQTECGTVACVAGHCALDPWFQERGFKIETIGTERWDLGSVTLSLEEFFGTTTPFFSSAYPLHVIQRGVTVDDAISALETEIERMRGYSEVSSDER